MIYTTKFFLIYEEKDGLDYKNFNRILWDLQNKIRTFKNRASSEYFKYLMDKEQWRKINGKYPNDDELLGQSMSSHLYDMVKAEIPEYNTGNASTVMQDIKKYFTNRKKDIFAGRISIPSYKSNQPIAFHDKSIKISDNGSGNIKLTLSIFSNEGIKLHGLKDGRFTFLVYHKCISSITILNHCLSGEYIIRASKMQYNDRKKMWEFSLAYDFSVPERDFDKDKILGIDLGVAIPIVAAISSEYKRIYIHGNEIEKFRKNTEEMRRQMNKSRVYAGEGSVGHGRDKRLQPVDRIGNRIANFRNTKNNAWSREIIDFAVKNKCGTIQMEDLSGITAGQQPFFLKSWTYYDLQQKIKYKAEAAGIDVVLINPEYTSQRCSSCGYISKGNRISQSEFVCQKCGYEENADYNAARNIATKDIEKIIKSQRENENAKVK